MDLKELSNKLDKILAQQELILNKLENKIVLESYHPNFNKHISSKQKEKHDMKDRVNRSIKEMMALRPHRRSLQIQFDLLMPPHDSRIKAYLATKDPKVFDGLKRNI
jgi:uncharacterized protein (DUF2344 family)